MMAAVDVPAYPESSMDQDDMPFPCKGCGEILDEGKAFELAGSRWHIDCFRCTTCGTLLDSDAHLLLLGDGSLICNNCTYSCSSCGSKIEDLAILTGDQAFCANCFKCRNCKNRIENLRYARTSQGIFCMDCHESLMQRRRKKNRAAPQAKRANPTGIKLDKSLPSLPQSAGPDTALSRESEKESAKTYPTSPDGSARSRVPDYYTPSNKRHSEESPVHQPGTQDNIILPSSTYRGNRHSVMSNRSDVDGGDEFLIPVAFDPTTEEPPSRAMIQDNVHPIEDVRQRDRVGSTKSGASSLKLSSDRSESLAGTSPPHIAYQEKGRQPGDIDPTRWRQDGPVSGSGLVTADRTRSRDVSTSQTASHRVDIHDTFKLQDPPKGRKSGSARSSKSDLLAAKGSMSGSTASSPDISNVRNSPGKDSSSADPAVLEKAVLPDGISESPRPSNELGRPTENGTAEPPRSFVSPAPTMHPKRGDSLEDKLYHTIIRKELGSSQGRSTSSQCEGGDDTPASVSTVSSSQQMDKWEEPPKVKPSGDTESLTQKHVDPVPTGDGPPDMAPEMAPEMQAQSRSQHGRNASISIPQSERPADANSLPSLLRYSAGGDFSMDEDMARILGADENLNSQNTESFLRRVSNSVRHGRSFSDKGSRFSKEPKWPKSPVNGVTFGQVISSPSRSSPDPSEEVSWLRSEIRRERQRVIERDQKISELEVALNSVAEVKQVNTELREKRSTMVVLDARKEIVLRELSVLTEHLEAEKHGGAPMDLGKLTNNVIRRFAESLQQLKDSFAPQIEELMQKRNDMVEELANLSRMKDKSFQEFEQLSCKNAQLAELNNELVHQIQGLYKANSGPGEATRAKNGLGLSKEKSATSTEVVKTSSHDPTISSATTLQEDAESATVVPGPQVVSIHKGQPRKFWKKGGQTVAKGVAKGLKGAFLSGEHKDVVAYHSATASQDSASSLPRSQTQDPRSQGFGFFVNQRKHGMSKMTPSGSSPALAEAAISAPAAGALFGTELEQRLEQEKCIIPAIVTRCIQEVELRGTDVEGIYRKSGAASVVQAIREGFERSPLDYDISDPDLDIHAVTSALKQYLRKLPTPLITYEVYDQILDSNEMTSPSARVEALRRSLHNLPRVHKDVLEFLVFHLKRVVEHEKENLMSSMNVAVVFAPTILRPETLAREMTDVQKKNEALKFLIDNCQETFMEM